MKSKPCLVGELWKLKSLYSPTRQDFDFKIEIFILQHVNNSHNITVLSQSVTLFTASLQLY